MRDALGSFLVFIVLATAVGSILTTVIVVMVPMIVAAYGPKCKNGHVPVLSFGNHPVTCVTGYKPGHPPEDR